ncbi:MAG: VCBS repeat domain-containing M23 family metallopeptidase [Deltaproteobacteria bacterium]|nr:VCBS repeat domain-containing M23 family metallopeptidase [Deltaproteobacteria bacterium]
MIRLAILVVLLAPTLASAQTRFRRPYAESYRLNYGFDTNGSAGGCSDYNCGGACYNGHTGEDFGTPTGTQIRAGQAGTVIARNDGCNSTGYLGNTCGGRCGNYVQLRHADGSRTIYCHMQNGSVAVSNGQSVSCGQVLGRSASSGNSTGPHLHFGYRSPGGASQTVWAGSCGRSSSLWVNQRGYREAPGTACSNCSPSAETCNGRDDDCDGRTDESVTRACSTACGDGRESCSGGSWGSCSAPAPQPETCNGMDDDCDGQTDDEDVCEIRLLHREPAAYAPPVFTDVDGDGLADVCGRGYSGVRCWPSTGSGWAESIQATGWGDDSGWDDVTNFSTIRMGDVDGDGRADVCARANGVHCAVSRGDSFESTLWLDGLADDSGWAQPDNYTTLRLADVNGDGRADLCARANAGMRCWMSEGAGFGPSINGPEWSDDAGFGAAKHYGTIRMADVNGDRLADLCARTTEGFECWLSSGTAFETRVEGPRWSDDLGWGAMQYWSTIRMADIDGDGRADVCARSATDLRCHRSLGDAFEADPTLMDATYASELGWDDESKFATLRVGDIDGDGRDDLCLRSDTEIRCLRYDTDGPVTVLGPGWSDDSGWGAPQHYSTFRLADVNGDGMDDVCARAGVGWLCHPSTGDGFGESFELGDMSNDGGWGALRYWSTIQSGGRACRPAMEMCNGRDDDCDGMVDETAMAEICNGVDDDCDGEVDESARPEVCGGGDDDCDGNVDEWVCGAGDMGVGSGPSSGYAEATGGCSCRAVDGRGTFGSLVLFLLVALRLSRRRLA